MTITMASSQVVFILVAVFSSFSFVQGEPQIVEPYPMNIAPFENGKAKVTCIINDTKGAIPDNIFFVRKNQFQDLTPVNDEGPSGRLYYTSKREDGGKTLSTTLHFNKVVANDDSIYQHWECRGNSSGVVKEISGFSVNVIKVSEIPTAQVKGATTNLGGSTSLTCDVTNPSPGLNRLEKLSWIKNSEVLRSVKYPAETIDPIKVDKATTKDMGEYVCMALVKFRNYYETNITLGTATLKINLTMVGGVTKVQAAIPGNVTLKCPAEGYPFNVTWWRINEDKKAVKLEMSQRYVASRPCLSCKYTLTIINLESRDSGGYACQVNSTIGSGKHIFELSLVEMNVNSTVKPTKTGMNVNSTVKPSENDDVHSGSMASSIQSTLAFLGCLVTWLLH